MFLQWVPTELREWYPEVMKDRHVLSQHIGEVVGDQISVGLILLDLFLRTALYIKLS